MIPSLFLFDEKIDHCLENIGRDTGVFFASVNIESLKSHCGRYGDNVLVDRFLTEAEQKKFLSFAYEKRKMEWLAGRIAAKYAAVKLCLPLENLPREHQVEWKKWEVAPDANGRPFLKTKGKIPGISISHSDGKAVAMAASCGTCGIDIQKISSRISKIESKFIDTNEKKFRRNDCLANFSDETFLTLVWSAKEALRKGSGFQPVIGFMEMTLVSVSGSRDSGLVFQFACTRNARKGQKRQIFTTCQAVCDDFALSIFYSPVPL